MRESLIPTLRETSFAEGTNGFQNFGQGTLSMLHGSEAVVPRNSEAGELLQAFYDRQSQPSVATGTQSMSNDKLDQLNNTMMQVASLLSQALGVQTRTMREVRAGGSDYFRSIGR
jgi:hypothetical protein